MSDEIKTILEELRMDHRNMAVLLDLLEQETQQIYDGEKSDFELMLEIMHYMTVYPDAVHHPKEDRIYAELKAVRPELSQGMSKITGEHRAIAEHSASLRDKLEQINAGDVVRRKDVVADASRYIEILRKHMNWEESDLFRRVDRMIADGHEVIDASIIVHRHDPLFGPQVEERFKHVLESLSRVQ